MRTTTKTALLGTVGLMALAGCADPNRIPGTDGQRTRQGAIAGATVGALAGAVREDDDRLRNAAVGAAIGGAVGAGAGYALDRQAQELRSQFNNSQIDVINNGDNLVVRMPESILFETDSATVNPVLRQDIGVLAGSLNRYPQSTVTVVGHTDSTGSAAYNQTLSERRAQAVSAILQQNGVSGGRVRSIGAGEDQPIASNQTVGGRQANRRVEITINPT